MVPSVASVSAGLKTPVGDFSKISQILPNPAQNKSPDVGGSVVITGLEVKARAPGWGGYTSRSTYAVDENFQTTCSNLVRSGSVRVDRGADGYSYKVVKPIRLDSGTVIPAGSAVTGFGFRSNPRTQEAAPESIKFALPNGNSIEFMRDQHSSGLGTTKVELFDKKSGVSTAIKIFAAPFFDTKSGSLGFLNSTPDPNSFRVSDLRSRLTTAYSVNESNSANPSVDRTNFAKQLAVSGFSQR